MMDEEGKAIAQVAKTTTEALQTVEKLGRFLAKVFNTVPEDVVGVLVGDWLHHVRMRNAARLCERTEEILRKRGIFGSTVSMSPSIALPLLTAAQDEDREELNDLWANLLANAMDSSKNNSIERWIMNALKDLEPVDVTIINKVCAYHGDKTGDKSIPYSEFLSCMPNKFDSDSIVISVDRLIRNFKFFELVGFDTCSESGNSSGSARELFKIPCIDTNFDRACYTFIWTPRGRQFVRACL